jgi:hypothetical protein
MVEQEALLPRLETAGAVLPPAGILAVRPQVWLAFLAAGCAMLILLPVIAARYPPLTDYPNHLARSYILLNLPHSAVLRRYYRDVMQAQPNLAMDLVIPALAHVMSIWTAGRVFVGVTLLAMAGGCILLHRALHRRWSSWPALSFLFVYNRLFLWGFLGYLFALGLALAGAAAWHAARDQPWPVRLALGTASATILYLLHLYGLGIYGVIIGGFQLTELIAMRQRSFGEIAWRCSVFGLQFAPAACLFLFVSPTSAALRRVSWGGIARKFITPLNLLHAYHPKLDLAMLAVVAAAGLVLLVRRKIAVARAARIPLGLLVALMFVMPNELFSSYGADRRIPIALALFAVSASDWHDAPARLRRVCMTAFSLLLALRMLLIWQVWAQAQPVYRGFISAFERLPEGARLVSAAPAIGGSLPLFHVDAYAVILRNVFLPSLFAAPWDAGSSIAFTPPYAALRARTPMVVLWPDMLGRLRDPAFAARQGPFRPGLMRAYEYGLAIHQNRIPPAARLPSACPVIAAGKDFTMVRFPCPAS